MTIWLIIIGMGVVTYGIRLSLIGALGKVTLPPLLIRGLRFVPPAVLTAIIVPELVLPGDVFNLSLGNARLLAGVLAALVAWRTKSVIYTVLVGMAALWILNALLPPVP